MKKERGVRHAFVRASFKILNYFSMGPIFYLSFKNFNNFTLQ